MLRLIDILTVRKGFKLTVLHKLCSIRIKHSILVLLEQSTMCIDNMISSGSLQDTTTVEVTSKAICGIIVEYKFPTESIVAATLGSLAGLALVVLTVKLMIDDQKVLFAKGNAEPAVEAKKVENGDAKL